MIYKILGQTADGSFLIITMNEQQWALYTSVLKVQNLKYDDPKTGDTLKTFIEAGKVLSVRVTTKTRMEILEEMNRNYPDKLRISGRSWNWWGKILLFSQKLKDRFQYPAVIIAVSLLALALWTTLMLVASDIVRRS